MPRSDLSEIRSGLSDRAEAICRRYLANGYRQGAYWMVGDKDGAKGKSMYVRLAPPGEPGTWHDAATGEHGDLLDIIKARTGGDFRAALAEARSLLGLADPGPGRKLTPIPADRRQRSFRDPDRDRSERVRAIWDSSVPINDTHAEAYLQERGIEIGHYHSLRYHPDQPLYSGGSVTRYLPCLVAAITTPKDRAVRAVQRTFLAPASPAKAEIADPRRSLGPIRAGAVILGNPARTCPWVIGEGIETTLSLMQGMPYGVVGAACLSAGNLGAFHLPPHARAVVIASDGDEAAVRGISEFRRRVERLGVSVTVAIPAETGDWNDELIAAGPDFKRRVADAIGWEAIP